MNTEEIISVPNRAESRCASCGAVRSGPYCSLCGQRALPGRHTMPGLVRAALSRVVGEEGLVTTAWQLVVRPGRVIRDYLAGRTVRYVHPIGYLLVAAAVFTIVGRSLVGPTGAAESDRLWVLLVIPLVAAVSRVCFWRGPYNYAEHLILVLYLSAQMLVMLTVLYAGTVVVPKQYASTYALTSLSLAGAYFVWGYTRVFNERPLAALAASVVSVVSGVVLWLSVLVVLVRLLRR